MTTPEFDLTTANTAKFNYKAFYEVEAEYDYLYVNAILPDGSKVLLDTIGDKANNADGSAETSNGKWEDKSYDLTQFKGKKSSFNLNTSRTADLLFKDSLLIMLV